MRSIKKHLLHRVAALGLVLGASSVAPFAALAVTSGSAPSFTGLAGIPLFFEAASKSSTDSFIARGQNCQVLIGPASARIYLVKPEGTSALPRSRESAASARNMTVRSVRMELVGANPHASMSGASPMIGKINELSGDVSEWETELTTWGRIQAASVYHGIDVVYYGNQQRLEYDFNVAPGANPSEIGLKFTGIDALKVDAQGDLVLTVGTDEIRQHRPIAFQTIEGHRKDVPCSYQVIGKGTVGLKIGDYRRDLPLVIDPVLSYSSYFGGGGGDIALAIRLGPDQSIYVAGQTLSRKFLFPIADTAFQRTLRGGTVSGDAFVAKFDSTGSNLVYFTYLGGGAEDGALDIAIDSNGNAYVTGFTTSGNFPVTNALYSKIRSSKSPYLNTYSKDAFVSVLNASGSGLIYSTYFGGRNSDTATAIAVDSTGAACITGTTASTNFPVKNPLPGQGRRIRGQDAFVAKIAPGGTNLVFSTYFGGNLTDAGQGIACDAQNAFYAAGYSSSQNLPITNAFQTKVNNHTNVTGALDAWVAKFSQDGALLYSTFLGDMGNDAAYRVAVDGDGNAYLTGYSQSTKFPNTLTNLTTSTNVLKPSAINSDAFLAKIGVDGNGVAELRYSALLGGYGPDSGWDVAVTPAGEAHIIGITTTRNYPTNNTSGYLNRTNSGGADVFVTGLRADASALLYSGYIGGSKSDYGYGITVSPGGEAYITGRTSSPNFPRVNAAQTNRYGANDAFIAVLSPEPVLQATALADGWEIRWWGGIGPDYALEASALPAPQSTWTQVSAEVKREGGWRTVHVPASEGTAFFRLKRL